MSDLLKYIDSADAGNRAYKLTGQVMDGATALGYSAFVQAITGEAATVIPLTNKRAKVILNERQVKSMQMWMHNQFALLFRKGPKPTLELDVAPFAMPFILTYAIPAALLLIAAGWVARSVIK